MHRSCLFEWDGSTREYVQPFITIVIALRNHSVPRVANIKDTSNIIRLISSTQRSVSLPRKNSFNVRVKNEYKHRDEIRWQSFILSHSYRAVHGTEMIYRLYILLRTCVIDLDADNMSAVMSIIKNRERKWI